MGWTAVVVLTLLLVFAWIDGGEEALHPIVVPVAAMLTISGLALAQSSPESILPPGFDDPAAGPLPRPSSSPRPAPPAPGAPVPSSTSVPVIQPIPGGSSAPPPRVVAELPGFTGDLPSLDQLEKMSTDDLDELLGLRPRIDMPAGSRRSLAEVGVLAPDEGGLPTASLANQPASLVRAALSGTTRPLVSRWGHILLRRALASRLAAPAQMDPAEFAALRIDVLLAQRYAGAAGQGRGAVTIEWKGIDRLTPLRFALASAVGEPVPAPLLDGAGPYYSRVAATAPMLGFAQRLAAAGLAGSEGILSSAAMIDLYSQARGDEALEEGPARIADRLRQAYVAGDPAARMAAIRDVWGAPGASGAIDYGQLVLTAYAAARLDPSEDFASDSANLVAAMLAAGFERDALRWAKVVPQGSAAWAQLVFAAPVRSDPVSDSAIDSFVSDDTSAGRHKSQFFVAGLAGLGRMDSGSVQGYSQDLKMGLGGDTKWTRAIDGAAAVDNQALVAFLAGLGMQGTGWDRMTARHLYHIVAALNRVGLSAEARMIAAEAVARG
jgi:hypothetical protein